MKKITMLAIVLVVAFAVPGFCMPVTLDHAIDHTMKSDIRPVQDTGKILDMTNKGIEKGYNVIATPMKPVLDPIRKVRDESLRGTKLVVNRLWDVITLKQFRA